MNTASGGGEGLSTTSCRQELAALYAGLIRYPCLALAVSGGADSVGLMHTIRIWLDAQASGPRVTVLTVDHRLRPGSGTEAEWVKAQAAALGFQHHTLDWFGEKPRTGIQASAREARYELMTAFCRSAAIPAIATAHTSDDQAETLIMRLARGSGLDGLSAMAAVSHRDGIEILRPLLEVPRQRIEAFLAGRCQSWVDDPSNRDERHERVRIRSMLKAAGAAGISRDKLALSARRLRRARDALEAVTSELLRTHLRLHEAGFAEMPLPALLDAPEEIALKALARTIDALGGRSAPLRLSKLEAYLAAMRTSPHTATLGGCHIGITGEQSVISREFGRMDAPECGIQPGETQRWDRRFWVVLAADSPSAALLRPLGADGVRAIRAANGRLGGVPRPAALTLPSLWIAGTLRYAPFASFAGEPPEGWSKASSARFANAGRLFGPGDGSRLARIGADKRQCARNRPDLS